MLAIKVILLDFSLQQLEVEAILEGGVGFEALAIEGGCPV